MRRKVEEMRRNPVHSLIEPRKVSESKTGSQIDLPVDIPMLFHKGVEIHIMVRMLK